MKLYIYKFWKNLFTPVKFHNQYHTVTNYRVKFQWNLHNNIAPPYETTH